MTRNGQPTTTVARPVMSMYWDTLTFLHWPYPVQALLPSGLTVQTYDGQAWVSLVPFVMGVRWPRRRRPLPWLGNFAETNVRTYVTAADGTEGIWFFSLEAERLLPVLTARSTFGLPYMWARMRVTRTGSVVDYHDPSSLAARSRHQPCSGVARRTVRDRRAC